MTVSYNAPEYRHRTADHAPSHNYLLPALDRILATLKPTTVFDLGCGNGSVASHLAARWPVCGVDASVSGIAQAQRAYPDLRLEVASAYDDLAAWYGRFDAVVSLEVVEHLLDPRLYARRLFDLVAPGGAAIVSTPFHGYWKNLALAVSGKMDDHFTALWDGGHIKFWSVRTLSQLLEEAGFDQLSFSFVGRVPQLAKSMIVVARRPGEPH
jgi:2-polyprenyl-3-methyl-5-hydroxy-6-metoxy-1,4-benzoquinol methylase